MHPYAPLWCKSNFSFLEGASHPEELIDAAAALGIEALALTDRDGVYGIVEAHVQAREAGVRLLVGSEITIDDGSTIVLLALDRAGYANLCRLITRGRLRSAKGTSRVAWREACEHAGGLLALWGGERSLLAGDADPAFVAHDLKDAFGDRAYALAARHRRAEEARQEERLRRRAKRYLLPVAVATEVMYHRPARRDLHDILACIRHGVRLTDAGRRLAPNAEHALKSPHAFAALFHDDPAGIALTRDIASRCRFSLDGLRYRYPCERLPEGATSSGWLRQLTFAGARERGCGSVSKAMTAQLDRELALIEELDYGGYFLTMWEIVGFCREQGILCQGRGSAASSAVCYCLGITAVDPVRMGFLFERFLSRERAEPPDIDLDIEHDRREEVIQHVYAKYGRDHAAMVCNIIRYRPRSAARDVGKALGLAEIALDRLSKLLPHHGDISPRILADAGLNPDEPIHRHLLRLASEILDFPRHLSIHPGGFLLGHEPVSTLVPIENATMEERTVIQWDKNSLEELGLFKIDLLGLGALHQLHRGFDLIERHDGERFTLATIPAEDPATFEMIRRADTVGVFQIESRAQMAMLPRLKPETYYDLVVEVSIVRPGPITGGMVHPYLRRREGAEAITYPHPCLEPVLAKTLGVPLFQEQVIRLAMVAADYTPGEADQLRRDMAAWRRSGRLERHHSRLVGRMTAKGIAPEFAERVFEQIRGFGEYGFPESHAASFALIAYATAWMKRRYPAAFVCSLLNAQPMGFYSPATIVEDARRHRIEVRPIDVLASAWDCTLEASIRPQALAESQPPAEPHRFAVRMGLRYVRGLAARDGERIVAARDERPFTSPEDLAVRAGIDAGALARLAEAGGFERLDPSRRSALWKVRGAAKGLRPSLEVTLGERPAGFADLGWFDTIGWDYQATAHSPRGHPLEPLRPRLRALGLPDARTLAAMPDGREVRYAGMAICRQRPGTASGVVFMTMEDESGFVNVIIWSAVFEAFAVLIKTRAFLGVTGSLQVRDGTHLIVAQSFWLPPLRGKPASGGSRDFH